MKAGNGSVGRGTTIDLVGMLFQFLFMVCLCRAKP
jgi:hypothetical protein